MLQRVKSGTKVHIRVTEQQDLAITLLQRVSGIRSVTQDNGAIIVDLEKQTHDFTPLTKLLIKNNFKIREIKEEPVNLETAFMQLTKGMVQ